MPSACPAFDELTLLFQNQATDGQVVNLGLPGFQALLLDEECEFGPFITFHKLLKIETSTGKVVQFVTLESNPSSDRQYLCVQMANQHQSSRHAHEAWTTDMFLAAARDLLASAPTARPKKSPKSK